MPSKCSRKLRKRKCISLDMKMEILNRLENREKPTSIAKSYGINESTVRTIKKMEHSIRNRVSSGYLASSKRSSYIRKPTIETMEKALMIWIEDNMQKKIPINSTMIRQEAVNIYNNIIKQATTPEQMEFHFSGSKGWFEKFKKRYSLCNLKFDDETASADKAVPSEYIPEIAKIIETENYMNEKCLPLKILSLLESALDHPHNLEHPNAEAVYLPPSSTTSLSQSLDQNAISTPNINHVKQTECGGLFNEPIAFTAENVYKGLQLAARLERTILDIDPNVERAFKFQQDLRRCCSEYRDVYENLAKDEFDKKSSGNRIVNNETGVELPNISTNGANDFEPIRKNELILEQNINTDNK